VFILNIILGTCKKNEYKTDISIEDLKKSFYVLVNKGNNRQIVNKYDMFSNIDFDNVKITANKKQTSVVVSNHDIKILRIAFHWKNKFQGGETPCLNVFLENDVKKFVQ